MVTVGNLFADINEHPTLKSLSAVVVKVESISTLSRNWMVFVGKLLVSFTGGRARYGSASDDTWLFHLI